MPAKPTAMQAKAMELIREGKTPTQAMREAGYSEKVTQAPGRELLRSAGVQSIIEQYKAEYLKVGITQEYLALKTAEWLEATKATNASILVQKDGTLVKAEEQGLIEVPDYAIQIKAAELVRKDWGMTIEQPPTTNTQNNFFLSDEQAKRIIEG